MPGSCSSIRVEAELDMRQPEGVEITDQPLDAYLTGREATARERPVRPQPDLVRGCSCSLEHLRRRSLPLIPS
jgi:hypothetical protein